ncbi:hypothetical protein BaRGS_00002890 [Batillaria attramentaria]|uniref:Uncharacterized protein n=1 Tax=Batillaria attramentaria TaxID=370345 RepID=A0ABD0M1L1_9CAEN
MILSTDSRHPLIGPETSHGINQVRPAVEPAGSRHGVSRGVSLENLSEAVRFRSAGPVISGSKRLSHSPEPEVMLLTFQQLSRANSLSPAINDVATPLTIRN